MASSAASIVDGASEYARQLAGALACISPTIQQQPLFAGLAARLTGAEKRWAEIALRANGAEEQAEYLANLPCPAAPISWRCHAMVFADVLANMGDDPGAAHWRDIVSARLSPSERRQAVARLRESGQAAKREAEAMERLADEKNAEASS